AAARRRPPVRRQVRLAVEHLSRAGALAHRSLHLLRSSSVADRSFVDRYGSWAVVAGGSEGLGAPWADALAAPGLNLLLVAGSPELLEGTTASIRARSRVEVRPIVLDLAAAGFAADLERLTSGLEVGFGVFNAAHAPRGQFLDLTLEDQVRSVEVNCRGPL